ncbi:MAG: hypothetical protein FWC40_07910 [Proteobacteria bacterium]|nr:hypothetical protein [Pseudomonadota bacterium]
MLKVRFLIAAVLIVGLTGFVACKKEEKAATDGAKVEEKADEKKADEAKVEEKKDEEVKADDAEDEAKDEENTEAAEE